MKPQKTVCARAGAPRSNPLQVRLINVEEALRAVVSLIEWASDNGNEPLGGTLAIGVTGALTKCASEVAEVKKWIAAEGC